MTIEDVQAEIVTECEDIKRQLLDKNRRYGNAVLEPLRLFSKANAIEQLLVRIDDKLSRVRSAQDDDYEDVIFDLIGYLILLKIVNRHKGE